MSDTADYDAVDRHIERCDQYQHAGCARLFTAEEVIEIANETSDSFGNLYRLDFIDRIRHEARVIPPG